MCTDVLKRCGRGGPVSRRGPGGMMGCQGQRIESGYLVCSRVTE